MKNRFLTLLLAVTMLFSVVVMPAQAAQNAEELGKMDLTFSAEVNTAVQLLLNLDILRDSDTFPANLGEEMTRAEFVKLAMRFRLDGFESKTEPFEDVEASSPYAGILGAAVEAGIVSYDTHFRPNDTIIYEEGLSVLFRVCGIDKIVDPNVAWPQNYIALAAELGLHRNDLVIDNDGHMTYEGFFRMVMTMLDARVLERIYGDELKYERLESTYLEEWYNVYEIEGVVTANSTTSVAADGTYDAEYLWIDGTKYYCGTKYQNLLGYYVNGYYKKDGNTNPLVCLYASNTKELTIKAEEIVSLSMDGDTLTIEYDDGSNKSKNVKVAKGINVIYNGKAFTKDQFMSEWFDIKLGTIKLIAANGNAYTTAFIDSYDSMVVANVDWEENIIYFRDDKDEDPNDTSFDLDDVEKYTIVDKDGKQLQKENIVADNVVSIKKAYDNKEMTIIVSNKCVTGTFSSMNKAEGEVTFQGATYEFLNNKVLDTLSLGISYKVWIDVFGYMIDFQRVSTTDTQYGFIIAINYDIGTFNKTPEVMFLTNGADEPSVFQFADVVTVDGEDVKQSKLFEKEDFFANTELYPNKKTEPKEYVRYKVDKDGKIVWLDTCFMGANEDTKTNVFKIYSYQELYDEVEAYNATVVNENDKKPTPEKPYFKGYRFGLKDSNELLGFCAYMPYSGTQVMNVFVPTDESDYMAYSSTSNVRRAVAQNQYNVTLYMNGTTDFSARCAVFRGLGVGSSSLTEDTVLRVVEDIQLTLDYDGNPVLKIVSVSDGASAEGWVPLATRAAGSSTIPEDLGVGDVISLAKNDEGYITAFKRYYRYETGEITGNTANWNAQIRIGGGMVYNHTNYYVSVIKDGNYDNITFENLQVYLTKSTRYIYDVVDGVLKYTPAKQGVVKTYVDYGLSADFVITKTGWEDQKSEIYFRSRAKGETSNFGGLKASFHEYAGAPAATTMYADSNNKIILPNPAPMNENNEFIEDEKMFDTTNIFKCWSDGVNTYNPGDEYTMPEGHNVAFQAVWDNSFKVSFEKGADLNKGEEFLHGDRYYLSGETFTLPENEFKITRHVFAGWSDGTTTHKAGASILVDGDKTFTAQWVPSVDISFAAPEGLADVKGDAPDTIEGLVGDPITLPANPFSKDGYVFKGWKDAQGNLYQAGNSFTVPGTCTLTAVLEWSATAPGSYGGERAYLLERTEGKEQSVYYKADVPSYANPGYEVVRVHPTNLDRWLFYKFYIGDWDEITDVSLNLHVQSASKYGTAYVFALTEAEWNQAIAGVENGGIKTVNVDNGDTFIAGKAVPGNYKNYIASKRVRSGETIAYPAAISLAGDKLTAEVQKQAESSDYIYLAVSAYYITGAGALDSSTRDVYFYNERAADEKLHPTLNIEGTRTSK